MWSCVCRRVKNKNLDSSTDLIKFIYLCKKIEKLTFGAQAPCQAESISDEDQALKMF